MKGYTIFFNYSNKEEQQIYLHAENKTKAKRYFELLIPDANITQIIKSNSLEDRLQQLALAN